MLVVRHYQRQQVCPAQPPIHSEYWPKDGDWKERLQNDHGGYTCDVKPQLNQSINRLMDRTRPVVRRSHRAGVLRDVVLLLSLRHHRLRARRYLP